MVYLYFLVMLLHFPSQTREFPNLMYMLFCVIGFELMLMKLSEFNELEIFRHLDFLHFQVLTRCLHFLDPFAEAML